MNEVANRITFVFLVAQNVQVQGNNPCPNQVAGGGVQGQGNNPNQNQVAGGGAKAKGNTQMEKMTDSKFSKCKYFLST